MKYLLDTGVILRYGLSPILLPENIINIITNSQDIYCSVDSLCEYKYLINKYSKKYNNLSKIFKLIKDNLLTSEIDKDLDMALIVNSRYSDVNEIISRIGYLGIKILDFNLSNAIKFNEFINGSKHTDPWDLKIISTAIENNLILITSDTKIGIEYKSLYESQGLSILHYDKHNLTALDFIEYIKYKTNLFI